MSQEWMLDLLSDLRRFADANGMLNLSEHLDDALIIAARDIREARVAASEAGCDVEDCISLTRSASEHDHAR